MEPKNTTIKNKNSKMATVPLTAKKFVDTLKVVGALDEYSGETTIWDYNGYYVDAFVKMRPGEFNKLLELAINEYKDAVENGRRMDTQIFEFLVVALSGEAVAWKNGDPEFARINPNMKLLSDVLWLQTEYNTDFEENDTKKKLIEAFQPLRKRGSEEESEE
jgi:hypothetical protein